MVQQVLKTQTTPLLLAEELLSYRAKNNLATASSKYMYGPSKFSCRCPLRLCDNGFTPARETSGETQVSDAIFAQTAGEPGRPTIELGSHSTDRILIQSVLHCHALLYNANDLFYIRILIRSEQTLRLSRTSNLFKCSRKTAKQ